jgi:asparagine synthase (glutamine-hydrolysing)
MRSDVPVGVFLSGGIDSSIVTAIMSNISEEPVGTYSIGFDEEAYDELGFAREVADMYNTDHHEHTVTPDSMDVLPQLVSEYEMPFGDPSALPTYYISQVASDDITVVLSGDAGDENFAGYDRYTWDWIATRLANLPAQLRQFSANAISSLPDSIQQKKFIRYPYNAFSIADNDEIKQYSRFVCHATDKQTQEVWNGPEPDEELAFLNRAFENSDGPTNMDRIMHVDLQTYLPNDLLVKVDRASMAHSLEVRSPLLDHELVEFAASVAAE